MFLSDISAELLEIAQMGLTALPGDTTENKIELVANVLGIAGFVMSLGLLGVGLVYRRGAGRTATHGDVERLGATVVEALSDRLVDRLIKPEIKRMAALTVLNDDERRSSVAQMRSSLANVLGVLTDSDTESANAAATALLHGNTRPAEEYFAERAAQALADGNDVARAAKALHERAALELLRDPEAALATCQGAAQLRPDDALGLSQLAHVYLRLGRREEARAAFDQALALNGADAGG